MRIPSLIVISMLAGCGVPVTDEPVGETSASLLSIPPIRACLFDRLYPDVATDGQRVYFDQGIVADQRVILTGYRYDDAPPTTAHPQGEGRETIYCGCRRVAIEDDGSLDGVPILRPYFVVPGDAPSGHYELSILPTGGDCPAGGIKQTTCPEGNGCTNARLEVVPSYVLTTSEKLQVNENSEDDDDNPAEMAFVIGATSGTPFSGIEQFPVQWSATFPGGDGGSAHITNADHTALPARVPLFVGRESNMQLPECMEECNAVPASQESDCRATCSMYSSHYTDQFTFAMNGVEYDASPSKVWGDLAGIAAGALTCAAESWLGTPQGGCLSLTGAPGAVGVGTAVAVGVNQALSNDDDNLGIATATATRASNWGIGPVSGPLRLGGSTRDGGDIDLYYRTQRVGGPRILSYAVRLKSLQVTADYEEGNCPKPNDVFVQARAHLFKGDSALSGTRRFPDTGNWPLNKGDTTTFGGAPLLLASDSFRPESAPESPFLYVELGVWEDDDDDDLMGIHADTIAVADVIGGQYPYTESTTPEGYFTRTVKFQKYAPVNGWAGSDNSDCWHWWQAHGWNPQAQEGGAFLQYEVELTWIKAAPTE